VVVLVGSKLDKCCGSSNDTKRAVDLESIERFATDMKMPYVECSAKSDISVREKFSR